MTNDEQKIAIGAFLRSNPLATLATVNEHGLPELSIVYISVGESLQCYFVTKPATRKFRNMTKYHSAALLVSSEDELTTVEMTGHLFLVSEVDETVRAVGAFQELASARKREYWVPPVSQLEGGHFVVCRFTPERIEYKHFDKTGEADVQSFVITQ